MRRAFYFEKLRMIRACLLLYQAMAGAVPGKIYVGGLNLCTTDGEQKQYPFACRYLRI